MGEEREEREMRKRKEEQRRSIVRQMEKTGGSTERAGMTNWGRMEAPAVGAGMTARAERGERQIGRDPPEDRLERRRACKETWEEC